MKKILISIILLLLFTSGAFAQRHLNCYPVFQGEVVPGKQMVVTEVRGSSMSTYKLDYYRGVTFQADTLLARKVAALVGADVSAAESAETEIVGEMLTYALVQPKTRGRIHRYLCYQARSTTYGGWIITLLYLEGSATLEDLRSMFEKQ